MKIYISVDMEGLAGITHWTDEQEERPRFRKAMNDQVKWVLEGIKASAQNKSISQIVVVDSHGGGENLSYDELSDADDRVFLVSGSPRPQYMMAKLSNDCDRVFLVGYHAGAGEVHGSMDHTYSGRAIHNIRINGNLMNEASINAGYAGSLGVPVSLIIGDSALGNQIPGMLPWVDFVSTKESLARFSAMYKPKAVVKQETIEAVQKTLLRPRGLIPLCLFDNPYHLEIDLTSSSMADKGAMIPGCRRVDGRTLAFELTDYAELMNCIIAVCDLAGRAYC